MLTFAKDVGSVPQIKETVSSGDSKMFLLWNINSDGWNQLHCQTLTSNSTKPYIALANSSGIVLAALPCLAMPCHIYFVHHRICFVFCKVYAFSFPLGGTCKQWIQLLIPFGLPFFNALALGIHNWSFKMHYMYIYKNLHQKFLRFVVSFTIYLCFKI